jgi:hypothetical protein
MIIKDPTAADRDRPFGFVRREDLMTANAIRVRGAKTKAASLR